MKKAPDAGSHAHDDRDTAQVRHSHGPKLRREEVELCGPTLWARGFFVSVVARDEEVIREYIRRQEEEDKRLDLMGLW